MRPFRKERVASAVRNIVSETLAHRLNDPRVAPLTTVTRVEVTADLQIAKVYISVPGDSAAENKTMAALRHASGFVQGIIAKELNLRLCPELRFLVDEAWKGARHTLALLDENRKHMSLTPTVTDEMGMPDVEDAEAEEKPEDFCRGSTPSEGGHP